MRDFLSNPPELQTDRMLTLLDKHGVNFVLSGSAALAAWGVDIEPRDLDIIPAMNPDNLTRLGQMLKEVNGRPVPMKAQGQWPEVTEEDSLAWTADPPTAENFDKLMITDLGLLDPVPALNGTYLENLSSAAEREYHGHLLHVRHLPLLIQGMLTSGKAKDQQRLQDAIELRNNLFGEQAMPF